METIVAAAIGAAALIVTTWMTTRASARQPPPGPAPLPVSADRTPEERRRSFGERLARLRAQAWQLLLRLPPRRRRARPWLAATLAFLFGGFGVALYFRRPPDVLAGIVFLLPLGAAGGGDASTGEPATAWWYWIFAVLAGLYALLRAESSNRRLQAG